MSETSPLESSLPGAEQPEPRETASASVLPRSPARGPLAITDSPTVITQRVDLATPAPLPASPRSPQEIGESLVGRQLGHFRLDRFVGGGGMGAVFEATDVELHRIVAVKVLTHRCDDATVRRFRMEAHSAARLNHDNIARVFLVGEHEGWNFIVFEYVKGENLRELVDRQGPLELGMALAITCQIASALDHASAQGLVHRDIKPSNILVTPEGRAKLVDMGLARLRAMEQDVQDLTASGVTLGTFDYISPEQGSDPRLTDVRSDLYSLGCTLYYMLTGRAPFPDGTPLQKLLRHAGDLPQDPRSLRPELPAPVVRVLHRLLAKRPSDRYQRPRDLLRDLLKVADYLGLTSKSVSWRSMRHRPMPRSRLRTHLPWMIPAILLACTWLVLEFLNLRSGPSLPILPDLSHVLPGPETPAAEKS